MDYGLKFLDYVEKTKLDNKELQAVLPGAIFIENAKTETQCYIYIEGNSAVIGFRGTEKKLLDWYTDIKIHQQVYPYGNTESKIKVHDGFIDAYKSVREDILKVIRNNMDKIKKTTVVGHSLGGALATLCAIDMQYNFSWMHTQCVTYGSPRVGNKAFCESFNKRLNVSYRFYNRTDIVPTVPFEWMGGYAHVEESKPLGTRDWFGGIKRLFNNIFKSERLMADLTNHSLSIYRDNLLNC